jgi:hypothetical protein
MMKKIEYWINYFVMIFAIAKCWNPWVPKVKVFPGDKYNMGQRPYYVNTLKNRNDRAVICKIRTSAHSLMIERGRYRYFKEYELQ